MTNKGYGINEIRKKIPSILKHTRRFGDYSLPE